MPGLTVMARLAEPGRALLGEGILTGGQLLGGHGRATLYKLKFVQGPQVKALEFVVALNLLSFLVFVSIIPRQVTYLAFLRQFTHPSHFFREFFRASIFWHFD